MDDPSDSAQPFELDASLAENLRLSHAYTRSSGLETPPSSDISTPTLDKSNFDGLLEDAVTDSLPLTISPGDAPTVAVMGVGYVGSHLVSTFSSNYPVIGFDVSKARINELRQAQFRKHDGGVVVEYTYNAAALRRATHILIAVPTLLRPDRTVDASFLREALEMVRCNSRSGATIVIESSVAVGMTRALLGPLAKSRKFYAGMSPEVSPSLSSSLSTKPSLTHTFQRVDPGRKDPPVSSIPKLVSALEDIRPGSLTSILTLYSSVFTTVIPVSSPEVAEMTKLYENCQRMVCIAYANEMADACAALQIDPFEVCRAAATKPFGYQNYTPGLGVGGHCIPVNPFYLLANSKFPILEHATTRMIERPQRIAKQYLAFLREKNLRRNARVLAVGMGFKKGQSTLSNSPGLSLLQTLQISSEVEVTWADSLVIQSAIPNVPKLGDDEWNVAGLSVFDLIVVALLQQGMDKKVLTNLPPHVEVKWLFDQA